MGENFERSPRNQFPRCPSKSKGLYSHMKAYIFEAERAGVFGVSKMPKDLSYYPNAKSWPLITVNLLGNKAFWVKSLQALNLQVSVILPSLPSAKYFLLFSSDFLVLLLMGSMIKSY